EDEPSDQPDRQLPPSADPLKGSGPEYRKNAGLAQRLAANSMSERDLPHRIGQPRPSRLAQPRQNAIELVQAGILYHQLAAAVAAVLDANRRAQALRQVLLQAADVRIEPLCARIGRLALLQPPDQRFSLAHGHAAREHLGGGRRLLG